MLLTTLSQELRIARNEANEDTTLLDLTSAGDFANRPDILGSTGVGVIDLLADEIVSVYESLLSTTKVNGIEFMFCGGNAPGKTFGWRLLAWRNINGVARLMSVGTGELGTQAVVIYPVTPSGSVTTPATNKFWADNLAITYENWPKELEATDTGNSNSQASVWMDDCGYRYWKVEITDADGSTETEAGDVAAYWSFW